ncbi:MAG TPA: hypothetical protein VLJ62_17740 [Burkholderiaceae bacterium]|nr:hypothetical protein [Burkholderiaceae bacterium]
MSTLPSQTSTRTALLAALIALGGAHAPAIALPDQAFVIESCPMAALGRDPSTAMRTSVCGVRNPSDLTSLPDLDALELMAIDSSLSGAGVVATLQCMSRASGALSTVALVRSVPSTSPKKVAVHLPAPLNFNRCAYVVRIAVNTARAETKALMVVLRK